MRIARFIAKSGLVSRRKAEELLKNKKIKVNSEIITDVTFEVTEDDKVYYEDRLLEKEKKITIALNKPLNCLSTVKDDRGRKTVIDLLRDIDNRVYPVGRIDYRSRGLILLTNDGDLANRIMHPSYDVKKKYEVKIDRPIEESTLKKIAKGVLIDKRTIFVDDIKYLSSGNRLQVTISEGRKRIIRRLFDKIGFKVIDLKRTQIGGLKLGDLKEGRYRILDKDDIKKILKVI